MSETTEEIKCDLLELGTEVERKKKNAKMKTKFEGTQRRAETYKKI